MNYEIERKILNNISLTDDEVNIFLSFICKEIRKDNGIYDSMDPNCKVCTDTSIKFGRIAVIRFGCDVEMLDIKKILDIPLTHYANFISFNVDGHKKTYLVDMTYSQFFGNSINLDRKIIVNPQKVFGNIEKESFAQKLRRDGFVELNASILKQYVDAFLNLCNITNKNQAYENINKLLSKNKINAVLKNK